MLGIVNEPPAIEDKNNVESAEGVVKKNPGGDARVLHRVERVNASKW